MRWEEIDAQVCSMARALAIFGDRWTLMIVRDAFRQVRRFSDFERSLGITKHRLSDRLNRLVEYGILKKVPYDESGNRFEYRLTRKGIELYPVLMSMAQWGDKWEADQDGPPVTFTHTACGQVTQPKYVCDCCNQPICATEIEPSVGPGILEKIKRGEYRQQ